MTTYNVVLEDGTEVPAGEEHKVRQEKPAKAETVVEKVTKTVKKVTKKQAE